LQEVKTKRMRAMVSDVEIREEEFRRRMM